MPRVDDRRLQQPIATIATAAIASVLNLCQTNLKFLR
jgi:hypothetical protein